MNPLALSQQLLVLVVLMALSSTFGFIGGCEYKTRKVEAAKLEDTKAGAKLAKQDATSGVNAAYSLRKKEEDLAKSSLSLSKAAATAPLVVLRGGAQNCPMEVAATKDSQPSEKVATNETPAVVLLSVDFLRMYDLSFTSNGDSPIRAGAYDPTKLPTINEGFAKVVIPNNSACSKDRERLLALQTRIVEKQKIYGAQLKKEMN